MASTAASRPKATPEQKEQILALAREGLDAGSIARQVGLHGSQVNGIINTARVRGVLPPKSPGGLGFSLPPETIPSEVPPMTVPPSGITPPASAPLQNVQAHPAPQPSHSNPDDFSGGRAVVASSDGMTGASSGYTYTVERIAPSDGVLGTHYGSLTVDQIGQLYGEGTYKITRREANKPVAVEFTYKIGSNYGPSRAPNAAPRQAQAQPNRPYYQRPWGNQNWRGGLEGGGHEAEDDPARAGAASYAPPRPYPFYYREAPAAQPSVYEFARHASTTGETVASKAIEMLGQANQRMVDEMEAARKSGPESHVTKILESQQDMWNKRWEEERKRDEERRKDDEAKWERKQADEQRRWERDQQADRDRHQRELDRIRDDISHREKREADERADREKRASEERKFLLDLEGEKLKLIQEQGRIQQERLAAQLKDAQDAIGNLQDSTTQEIRDTRAATQQHIEKSQAELKAQLERDRDQLEREHKLKEKMLDREHQLQEKMLDMQKENLQQQMGDQLFTTINTVIKEFSKGLEKVVDLQKLKAMTPEAQAAAVARGAIDGNVLGEPPPQQAPAQNEAQRAAQAAAAAQEPQGNGHGAPQAAAAAPATEESIAESRMDSIIKENLKRPFFQEVMKEWAVHVESGTDSTAFANLYLEMMRDPVDNESRRACSVFATYMKPRNWQKMFAALRPGLDAETIKIFELPQAAEFYESFRAMVVLQIADYWDNFMATKVPGQQQPPAPPQQAPVQVPAAVPPQKRPNLQIVPPANGPAAPPAQAPVEPPSAPGESAAPEEPAPVPTRESLRASMPAR